MVRVSIHWSITCDQTGEAQDFQSKRECRDWAEKVRATFSDRSMTFRLRKIVESETQI